MKKVFQHPLARTATIAKVRERGGGEYDVLVIVTTLELDAGAKNFKSENVERLHEAAKAFVAETEGLAGYTLVNRPKDWRH